MRISDVEVKALFEDRKFNVQSEHVNTKNNLTFKNRNYIVEKTAEYIKNSTLPDNATSEMVTACFERIREKGFELTESELISIVNHVPVTEAEILTLIPTIEQRYPHGLEDIQEIIAQSFCLDLSPEVPEEEHM